jgi:hypothetical protein
VRLLILALVTASTYPFPPTPIGAGPRFHPPPASHPAGLRCPAARPFGVHLELFARNRVIIVPAGIKHRCVRMRWPIGVLEVRGRQTLGGFFRLWGQPLSGTRLAGFRTTRAHPVRAYVAGKRWRGPLRAIPLRRHENVVLQLGRRIPPKKTFLFPRGL